MSDFTSKVRDIVKNIKRGETMTYKQVAETAGSLGAARAVGTIMRSNYDPNIPCHRVIKSDGSLGDYNRGGTQAKAELLAKEKHE
jgi:O-6-methylguanine DNA methyltransferase